MSNTEQKTEEHNEGHSAMIKTPKQLLVTVALAFLVPIAIIVMLVSLVTSTMGAGAGSAALSPEAIAARIQPVAGFKLVDANAVKELVLANLFNAVRPLDTAFEKVQIST